MGIFLAVVSLLIVIGLIIHGIATMDDSDPRTPWDKYEKEVVRSQMENKTEAKWLSENKRYTSYTSGRCWKCNVRYVWRGKPRLKDALCPNCGLELRATTHLFKAGPTIDQAPVTKGRRQ